MNLAFALGDPLRSFAQTQDELAVDRLFSGRASPGGHSSLVRRLAGGGGQLVQP